MSTDQEPAAECALLRLGHSLEDHVVMKKKTKLMHLQCMCISHELPCVFVER